MTVIGAAERYLEAVAKEDDAMWSFTMLQNLVDQLLLKDDHEAEVANHLNLISNAAEVLSLRAAAARDAWKAVTE